MAEDTFSMRQDAVRRMREMYSRARPQQTPAPSQRQEPPKNPPQEARPEPAPAQTGEDAADQSAEKEKSPDLFETFFKDKEKMLILALLVILSQESCDNSLLFALMFLLM